MYLLLQVGGDYNLADECLRAFPGRSKGKGTGEKGEEKGEGGGGGDLQYLLQSFECGTTVQGVTNTMSQLRNLTEGSMLSAGFVEAVSLVLF